MTVSRREIARQETIAAIREIALEKLALDGAGSISLNEIARRLGFTGPALFRYVPSRNQLLTDLVVDAYTDLGDTLWAAVDETVDLPVPDRLRYHATALRAWALANRHRYALIFGAPVAGHRLDPEVTRPLALRALASTFALAPEQSAAAGQAAPLDDALSTALSDWARDNGVPPLSDGWLKQAILGWTRLHGVLSLELEGHFGAGLPGADVIYDSEVEALIGLVEPGHTGSDAT